MKIKTIGLLFLGVTLWLATPIRAQSEATNTAQTILQDQSLGQKLVWVGATEPAENENRELLDILRNLNTGDWRQRVEQFLEQHPASPWAASLHHVYASYCRETGRTTKALDHWQSAWLLLKNDSSEQGKRLGNEVLTEWMSLLSSLGRLETLRELVAEGNKRVFNSPQQREKFVAARSAFQRMQQYPELSYRCGTFALKAIGERLEPGRSSLEALVDVPSPTNGFTLEKLSQLAEQNGLNLVMVHRPKGAELIVPSVVHWRQNHYAAILQKMDDNYLVSDPTFGTSKWLPREVIDEESSDVFLIPADKKPAEWTLVSNDEAKKVHGMGLPSNTNDGKDKKCNRDFNGNMICIPCKGMPVWWVSEPYINLWIADEPLSYLTSKGEQFTFAINYKQRDSHPSAWQSLPGWNNNWLSYINLKSEVQCLSANCGFPTYHFSDATLYLPGGGTVVFPANFNNTVFTRYDNETRITLQPVVANSEAFVSQQEHDNGVNGFRVIYPDGSQDVYGLSFPDTVPPYSYASATYILTRRIDAHGNTTFFNYYGNTLQFSGLQLTNVIDYDGKTNFLKYTVSPSHLSYLTEVDSPYGTKATMSYDSNYNLTNIVDAQGLSSRITYDTNGYPTSLITPYGTNRFVLYVDPTLSTNGGEGDFGGHNLIDRAAQVTDPTGATSLYLYRYDSSSFMPTNFASSDVPTNTPLGTLDTGTGGTNLLSNICYRNSFYWNPRQYAALSTTNMSSFTANDYIRGRMRHWLQDTNDLDVTGYISVERDPSPDGTTEGLKTFYDYLGKIFNHREGTNALPSVKAWRLPGGETHYEYVQFDSIGNITNHVETYTKSDGTLGARTNRFVYVNNTYTNSVIPLSGSPSVTSGYVLANLLTQITAPDGSNVWTFGGFDTVSTTNYLYEQFGPDTNRNIQTWQRVLPNYATNGVNEVTTLAWTFGDRLAGTKTPAGLTTTNLYNGNNQLWKTVDIEIGRTNSLGYYTNNLIATITNELELVVNITWDNLIRPTSVLFPDNTYISNRFDRLDLGGSRDRLGNWTSYGYDGARHLTSVTNALTNVTSFTWCGCGSLESIRDALNQTTSFTRDLQSRMTGVSFADGSSLSFQFDLAGRYFGMADGLGRGLLWSLNNQGLPTVVSNAYGPIAQYTLDIRNRSSVVIDANNVAVTNTFDALDRLLKRTWQDGGSESAGYSARGLVALTNRDSRPFLLGRDAARRIIATTNANLEIRQFGYNAADDLITLTDELSHVTTWHRNEYGWVTNKVDALNREIFRYTYNANGWLTNRWMIGSGNTGYTYDNIGNLKTVNYPSSSIGYSYDPLNRLTNMVDAVGTTVFGYTQAGQLQSETGPWASDAVTYNYAQQLRSALTLAQSSTNWPQTYGYDSAWRLTSLASPAGGFLYGYESPNSYLLSSISLPNGAYVTNSYDSLARLNMTALVNHWGHVLDGYSYQMDLLGLRTNIVRNFGLTTNIAASGYDNIGQLTSWMAQETNGVPRLNEQYGWAYDKAHNLQYRTNNGFVQTFTTDPVNELTNVTRSGTFTASGNTPAPVSYLTVNGATANFYSDFTFAKPNISLTNGDNLFTIVAENNYSVWATNATVSYLPATNSLLFDLNGNLTNDGTKSFFYDAENQLTNITVAGAWKSEFVYDGLNRRRIALDYTWTGSAWSKTNEVRYVYDGMLPIQERDANNNVLVTYTRGLDMSGSLDGAGGIGGLLARTDANGSAFYHTEGIGNVTALIDGYQNIVARYLYSPFGKQIGQWGALASENHYRFSSKEIQPLSGVYYYGGRFAEPNLQRWLNHDPASEAFDFNLYRFVENNPIDKIDSNGENSLWIDGQETLSAMGGFLNWIGDKLLGPGGGDFLAIYTGTGEFALASEMDAVGQEARTWNRFQSLTRGQFASRADAAKAWTLYKEANSIVTSCPRNAAARSQFLKQLANDWRTPSWQKQWLSQGLTPPGYDVDHIIPLSVGGADSAINMRLQGADIHEIWHQHYDPWNW
jgi:RHS repeat-associated protein